MPIHDWTRVDAGIFHAFHHDWITEIARALNRGLLPAGYYALPEQIAVAESQQSPYIGRPKAVTVRHVNKNRLLVAMLEILFPGTKKLPNGWNSFVPAPEVILNGIPLLLVDLFSREIRNPKGIEVPLTDNRHDDFDIFRDKPLTCIGTRGGPDGETLIEKFAVGDTLPDMPLFLTPEVYVPVPLEATYQRAWDGLAAYWRDVLTNSQEGSSSA